MTITSRTPVTNIKEFQAKYGCEGATLIVKSLLDTPRHPDATKIAAEMMADLECALYNLIGQHHPGPMKRFMAEMEERRKQSDRPTTPVPV